jgi:hypothetical protein
MASRENGLAKMALQTSISVAVALALVAVATLARAALTPALGADSPFIIYVAAVLTAGLVRGPVCGGLVMLIGGAAGLRLFLSPHGVATHGSIPALMLFWGVSAPVLVTANELRVQLGSAMAKLSAALRRRESTAL